METRANSQSIKLSKVIDVDKDKCVNCHRCIAVCPVKFCNDGSGDTVLIDENLCIGCGECLRACTHEARIIIDDFDKMLAALDAGERIVAVVAPAIAAGFPDQYLQFNSWLKSIGISAIFDVSFGAELTVKSYLEYVGAASPKLVIAQPCPALVTYIELYQPELIPHLAPADSPMMHTMKMIREFYPAYAKHKIAVISPCVAKKREFDAVGIGNYNVTIIRIKEYFKNKGIDLSKFRETDFDNDPAERAVLFSTPGGLMRTAERENPDIVSLTRKIEGPEVIYPYLAGLKNQLDKGNNPLLIDCLNCALGCNGGTGTGNSDMHPDELEFYVEKRREKMQEIYHSKNKAGQKPPTLKKIQKTVNKYWKAGLYSRSYRNLSGNNFIRAISDEERDQLYKDMHKFEETDIKNCNSCGYHTCEQMATACHYELNKIDNCHFYLQDRVHQQMEKKQEMLDHLNRQFTHISQEVHQIQVNIASLVNQITEQFAMVDSTTRSVTQGIKSVRDVSEKLDTNSTHRLVQITNDGGQKIENLTGIMSDISAIVDEMNSMITLIDDISTRTNILSINAAIQSAQAGEFGKSFAVVSREIKNLAQSSSVQSDKISRSIKTTIQKVKNAIEMSQESGASFKTLAGEVGFVDEYLTNVSLEVSRVASDSEEILEIMSRLSDISIAVKQNSENIHSSSEEILTSLGELENISTEE
ncbi:MAG: 4Fe-4S binding protein [Brevinematales bacterium]|nr:4Fe-4S binding protein [Brevinematales bacterium]